MKKTLSDLFGELQRWLKWSSDGPYSWGSSSNLALKYQICKTLRAAFLASSLNKIRSISQLNVSSIIPVSKLSILNLIDILFLTRAINVSAFQIPI